MVCIVAPSCFTRRGQSLLRAGLGRFDLGRNGSTTKSHVFSGGPGFSGSGWRQARGHWLFSSSGALSRHAWQIVGRFSSADPGCSERSCSSRPPRCLSASSGMPVCRRRAALGVIHTAVSSRALGLTQGSCERRYNHRLHQTAPREHRSHAGHGQPQSSPARIRRSGLVKVGYTAGTRVPRTALRWRG